MRSVPSESPVVTSLSTLFEWKATSDGEQAASAWSWQQLTLAIYRRADSSASAFRRYNVAEHDVSDATASRLVFALAQGHVFARRQGELPIQSWEELEAKLLLAVVVAAQNPLLDLSSFLASSSFLVLPNSMMFQ